MRESGNYATDQLEYHLYKKKKAEFNNGNSPPNFPSFPPPKKNIGPAAPFPHPPCPFICGHGGCQENVVEHVVYGLLYECPLVDIHRG